MQALQSFRGTAYGTAGAGRPVVFLHGVAGNTLIWRPVVEHLESSALCLLVDLPGHGFSEPWLTYKLVDVVERIHEILDQVSVNSPVMVGHSLGGALATIYAARYPTTAVVNVDQVYQLQPIAEFAIARKDSFLSPEFYLRIEELTNLFGLDKLDKESRHLFDVCWNPSPPVVMGYWKALWQEPWVAIQTLLTDALQKIPVTYIAIHGSPVPDEYRKWLTGLNQNIRLLEWDGGHYTFLPNAAQLAELIRNLD